MMIYILCGCGGCVDCDVCTLVCVWTEFSERVRGCEGDGNDVMGAGRGVVVVVRSVRIWVVHVVHVLCLVQTTC